MVKAVVFDRLGNERASHECPMPLRRPEPLWIEHDMEQLCEMVKLCLGKVAAQLGDQRQEIAGIGITSTGDGTWIIDQAGNPVRCGILWCDGRAGKVVERLHAQGIAQRAFDICGTSVASRPAPLAARERADVTRASPRYLSRQRLVVL